MEKLKISQIQYIDDIVNRFKSFSLGGDVRMFIACQFALESAFGTSRIACIMNNHCGMKLPFVRPTTAFRQIPDEPFACYDSIFDCVIDYSLWLCYNRFSQDDLFDLNRFLKKLVDKNYCSDSNYIQSIINLFKLYQNEK